MSKFRLPVILIIMLIVLSSLYFMLPRYTGRKPFLTSMCRKVVESQDSLESRSRGVAVAPESPFLCDNLLANITDGYWVKNSDLVPKDSMEYRNLIIAEEEYDSHLARYRIERGIHTQLWREDGKCGFEKYELQL